MNIEHFKIYIDRLRDGKVETVDEVFSADFLDQNSADLAFVHPVKVKGKTYIASDELILQVDITTTATLPCSICNEPVDVLVNLPNFYHIEPLDAIKSAVFVFDHVLREAILLEVPQFAECAGNCPARGEYSKYLGKKEKADGYKVTNDEGYKPFADLNENNFD